MNRMKDEKDNIHETKIHGRIDFPYIVYLGKIPDFLKSFPLHWHEEFEIIMIKSGTGNFRILTENYTCNAGDILVIPPNLVHAIHQKDSEIMEYFNILFKFQLLEPDENSTTYQKYFAKFLQNNFFTVHLRYGTELNSKIRSEIEYLIDNRHEKYETQELMIKSKLFKIIHYLQAIVSPLPAESKKNVSQISRLKPLLKYTSENFSKDISINQAAEICNLSPSHFMKFFKKMTGITFVNYLNLLRLEKAQVLLKSTDLTVSEVAEQVGFHNFSYFIRSFHSQYGTTPGRIQNKSNIIIRETTAPRMEGCT